MVRICMDFCHSQAGMFAQYMQLNSFFPMQPRFSSRTYANALLTHFELAEIEDFMLCKSENRDPAHCLKEGRRVTRCAQDLYAPPSLYTLNLETHAASFLSLSVHVRFLRTT